MSEQTVQEQPPAPEAPAGPPPLTAEEIDAIVQASRALQQSLDQDPAFITEIEQIIREHTRGTITTATMDAIQQGLALYLDDASARYLLTVLAKGNDAAYIEEVKKAQTSPRTWSWLRRLLALYGNSLREADVLGGMNEDSWRVINRRAYYDAVTERWGVNLEFVKYSGEQFFLNETLDSTLLLANGILDTLNRVPPEVATNSIIRDIIQRFTDLSLQLIKLYAPDMLEESGGTTAEGEQVNRCPQCGQLLRVGAKFCPHCGTQQST